MRVSPDVLAVLDRAICDGPALSLAACGLLDRKLYEATNRALEAAGGKWNRKAKAHLFDGDAAEAIEPIILTGEIVSKRQELQQFYTPEDLARRVIAEARLESSMSVLEPSAGRGALAAPAFLLGAVVDCIEIDPRSVHLLASVAYNMAMVGDFLALDPDLDDDALYDRVVMNPPFSGGQDIRHVMHAARFLKPGGRLVAIMSAGIIFRRGKPFDEFRAFLDLHRASVVYLPDDAFAASGTRVRTVLVSFDAIGSARS